MSFKSDVAEIGSDAAGPSNGRADASSHDHGLAHRDNNNNNNPLALSWLSEVFLHAQNRSERIAAGSPRSGVGIIELRLLGHHINLVPSMRNTVAVPVFDHSAGSPRYLGWRQKVATWPLLKQEGIINRTFAA